MTLGQKAQVGMAVACLALFLGAVSEGRALGAGAFALMAITFAVGARRQDGVTR